MNTTSGPRYSKRWGDRCQWWWQWDNTAERCIEDVVPGEDLCPDHLIEQAGQDGARI